ncbi:hypothetical protein FGG08_000408 [Glutinoglossum americanum]|uniref:Lon protease homolog 2, peroxisomal n=1 Tax=Glutinoglossum americanum TaxID=1670608 RepID=A0A9P8L6X3_9PEZI|nr:hypothetical protein FGG08_000408 [Glutinoglossum americanum]
MGLYKPKILPLIPLPNDTVLLPGIIIRVPIANRPDILALLSKVYSRANTQNERLAKEDTTAIGCVPLRSPLLSNEGQKLTDSQRSEDGPGGTAVDPSQATKEYLFGYGTVAKVAGLDGRRTTEPAIVVEGVITQPTDIAIHGLFAHLKQLSRELLTLLRLSLLLPRVSSTAISPLLARRLEFFIASKEVQEAGVLADFMSNIVEASYEEKLQVLAAWGIKGRLEKAIDLISRQISAVKGNVKITTTTGSMPSLDVGQLTRKQKEALMRRVLGGVGKGQPPPGIFGSSQGEDGEEEGNELEELKRKLVEAKLTPEADRVAQRELKRLKRMSPAQAEYQVCRNYLENLSEIPWAKVTDDQFGADTLSRARKQLDDDHYGLENIKKRLLEYLAVLKLKQQVNADLEAQISKATEEAATLESKGKEQADRVSDSSSDAVDAKVQILRSKRMVDRSPILLLVGPPGTGKTSLAKSVATALGRKFHRISLGGVRDEAEIRGHRRTYVAAMPGLIVGGLKKVGVANPVFLLDEIDKVGTSNFHGDPSAAMLEVLDPEQNYTFTDHYVNIPIDLSKVLFIATANNIDTIPPPLLDRMEMISLSGYTTLEKRHIASQYLIPKQLTANGLREGQVQLPDEVIDKIITSYTRESGVRNLEREIGSVCRFKAVEYADAKDSSKVDGYKPQISVEDIEIILGIEKYDEEIAEKVGRPGIVTGLVAYSTGGNGSILFIEVADMPGSGRVHLTGKLGDVLKESVEVALTWVKAHSYDLGLTHDPTEDIMKNRSVHVHCPSGAIPKDGPSAGLAHTIALISLFSGKAVSPTLAMTGEISLRGRILPVGGIKEKLIGALRAGVKTVLLPAHNQKDAKDLPAEVKGGLDIIFVSSLNPYAHILPLIRSSFPQQVSSELTSYFFPIFSPDISGRPCGMFGQT